MAHAVGLDPLMSAQAILSDLAEVGYTAHSPGPLSDALQNAQITWPLTEYLEALAQLSNDLSNDLREVWGEPTEDVCFSAVRLGNVIVALQPERGDPRQRDDDYHDLSRTPCDSYVAFCLWLQKQS